MYRCPTTQKTVVYLQSVRIYQFKVETNLLN